MMSQDPSKLSLRRRRGTGGPQCDRSAGGIVSGFVALLIVVCGGLGPADACAAGRTRAAAAEVPARLAAVDSLLAVGEAGLALADLAQLAVQWGDDPLYGWQIADRRGLALLVSGRVAEALPWLEQTVGRDPLRASAHRNLALALARLGRRGRALAEYAQAAELAPRDPAHRLEHAQYLAEFGQWEPAAAEFRVASTLCGGCPEAARGLGASLLELGRPHEAVAPLMQAQAAAPDSTGRRLLVAALHAARRDSALLALLDAEDPATWYRQDLVAQVEAEGRLARGVPRSLAHVAALEAGAAPAPVAADPLFWGRVALNLLKAHEEEAGLVAVDRAIALDPASVVYRNNRVVLLTRLGRHDEAAREWAKVLELDPTRREGAGP